MTRTELPYRKYFPTYASFKRISKYQYDKKSTYRYFRISTYTLTTTIIHFYLLPWLTTREKNQRFYSTKPYNTKRRYLDTSLFFFLIIFQRRYAESNLISVGFLFAFYISFRCRYCYNMKWICSTIPKTRLHWVHTLKARFVFTFACSARSFVQFKIAFSFTHEKESN